MINELAKQAGVGGETVKNLLAALAENNRLGYLKGVCVKFGELMSASRGEVELKVTSAQVSSETTMKRASPQHKPQLPLLHHAHPRIGMQDRDEY